MKALIAMSGGVDSSVTAFIMKNKGYDCVGATMSLLGVSEENDLNVQDAKKIAERLSMPYHVFDLKKEFREKVIDKFIASYEAGLTPNPCVECNRHIKFGALLKKADELGCKYMATGHYADIVEKDGCFRLKKAEDLNKDQSYFLYSLTQRQLARVIFPLGKMTKDEARKIAEENGFINARKGDSQDICFVPGGDYVSVIEGYTNGNYPEGNFVKQDGTVLGTHKGIIRYTVGQRKGLGLALSEPMYVCRKDVEKNEVVLCKGNELYVKSFYVRDVNWIAYDSPPKEMRASVRVRYRQKEQPALIESLENGARITFDEPQRAVALGQAAVFYDGDFVLGGGTISDGRM